MKNMTQICIWPGNNIIVDKLLPAWLERAMLGNTFRKSYK